MAIVPASRRRPQASAIDGALRRTASGALANARQHSKQPLSGAARRGSCAEPLTQRVEHGRERGARPAGVAPADEADRQPEVVAGEGSRPGAARRRGGHDGGDEGEPEALRGRRVGPVGRRRRMAISWREDFEAAAAEAREAGRPLFVDFKAPG